MPAADRIADHFKIEACTGDGEAGTVYRARDLRTGALVALKMLGVPLGSADAEQLSSEARAFAEIRHPHVVRYLDHGESTSEPSLYIAMEWLDGETLRARLERSKMTQREAMDLIARVTSALAAIHARGVVHRDIKPRTLFLPGGELAAVKVLDPGVIRPGGSRVVFRRPLDALDVGYMAPERAMGRDTLDARCDVFSLGAVIFRCVAGRPAFAGRPDFVGKESWGVLEQIVSGDSAPLLSEACPGAPRALCDLVARMLAKKKEERPADAAEVARELAGIEAPG
jgi:eukaryotic-like serine/threonine-protein kinase